MSLAKGWIKDQPDQRDFFFSTYFSILVSLPQRVDLRQSCPQVRDQGQLGSCTAFAITSALMCNQLLQKETVVQLSELFVYFNERLIERDVYGDYGASIRDGMKSVNNVGACSEILWPYDISKFTVQPPQECYQDAQTHKSITYFRVPRVLQEMKGCLASGFPVVFGISVYESFMTQAVEATGKIPLPTRNEQYVGGHALLLVGYDDATQCFTFQNSWSAHWGDHGYGYIPYQYLLDTGLSDDFWTIRKVA